MTIRHHGQKGWKGPERLQTNPQASRHISRWATHEVFRTFLPNCASDLEQVCTPQDKSPAALGWPTPLLNDANHLLVTPLDGILPHGEETSQGF